jgi:hypothetical protein
MPARHGSRFALEAGFLILLAVLAGLADLRWQAIVLVMGGAWLLIALLEWAFWREGPRVPPVPRGYAEWAPPVTEPTPPPPVIVPPPPPVLPPLEDRTRIIEPGELEPALLPAPMEPEAEAPEPEPEPEPPEPKPLEPEPVEPKPLQPEPLEPAPAAESPEPDAESAGEDAPPRRPWWWRRREPETEAEPVRPRHVRVLPPGPEREEE